MLVKRTGLIASIFATAGLAAAVCLSLSASRGRAQQPAPPGAGNGHGSRSPPDQYLHEAFAEPTRRQPDSEPRRCRKSRRTRLMKSPPEVKPDTACECRLDRRLLGMGRFAEGFHLDQRDHLARRHAAGSRLGRRLLDASRRRLSMDARLLDPGQSAAGQLCAAATAGIE